MLTKVALYWHTVRHLRPEQIYGRLLFRLRKPHVNRAAAPALARRKGNWVTPARRRPSMTAPDAFVFLNQPGDVRELGWEGDQREKLWRYNQHYFDDLNAQDAEARREWHVALLRNWVGSVPAGSGVGWEPYPTSLRIVNWIKWAYADHELSSECVQSLAVQTRWLTKRIEWHLLGNHLFANAKALVFAGLFFDGEEAGGWLRSGLEIIAAQLDEQILSDGGHFERSTMYHLIALEDVLDIVNIVRAAGRADSKTTRVLQRVLAVAERMLRWMDVMTHPDGEISLFNDAALGITPTPAEMRAYATRLGLPEAHSQSIEPCSELPASGYVRLSSGPCVAIIDVGPVGPDYLPGHAHADTLSFECSVGKDRLIVNGGTSCYGASSVRQFERSTAAHSTVEIDGRNSSEVWAGFRVARRAYPKGYCRSDSAAAMRIQCGHDGYRRLRGRPLHHREWLMSSGAFRVEDNIEGHYESAVARFIVHPAWRLNRLNDRLIEAHGPTGQVVRINIIRGEAVIAGAYYAPEFGMRMGTSCVELAPVGPSAIIEFCW